MTKLELQELLAGLHRDLDAMAAEAARERKARLRGLQAAGRSLRQAESTAQWVQILADAAAPLANRIAFFRVEGAELRCEAARGMEPVSGIVLLANAPAFRQAVETRETVVSLFVASEVGIAVETGSRRAHLFPLVGKSRVLGVMLAVDDGEPDVYGLEVLLSLGAATLELRDGQRPSFVEVIAVPASPVESTTARRFARTTVARWILEEPARVSAGRARGDLYAEMRELIDGARSTFGTQHSPGPDYLHDEILARLALGTPALLGPNYPSALGGGDG